MRGDLRAAVVVAEGWRDEDFKDLVVGARGLAALIGDSGSDGRREISPEPSAVAA